jgi:RNA polymerase sigma-70 factor (ECF subfamily)
MTEPDHQPDGEEFTRLLLQNQKRMWGLILSLVPNGPDADDVMQETCAVLWRKFGEFERGTDFGAWGLRMARFQVMSYYNRQRRAQARLSDETIEAIAETLSHPRWEASDHGEALRTCLAKLKPRELELVRRRYHDEQRIEQIAAERGGTVYAVYKALARLQMRLLACVQNTLRREGTV